MRGGGPGKPGAGVLDQMQQMVETQGGITQKDPRTVSERKVRAPAIQVAKKWPYNLDEMD